MQEVDIVFISSKNRYKIDRACALGMIRTIINEDTESKEVPIAADCSVLAEKVVIAYMQTWKGKDEQAGPRIEELTFSKYNDFLTPEEIALADAVKAACSDNIVYAKTVTNITELANYLGLPEMVKKFGAISALAYMNLNFQEAHERIRDVEIPHDFAWKLGDTYKQEDLLSQNPTIERDINKS